MALRLVPGAKTKFNFEILTNVPSGTNLPSVQFYPDEGPEANTWINTSRNSGMNPPDVNSIVTKYYLPKHPQGLNLIGRELGGTPTRRENGIYEYIVTVEYGYTENGITMTLTDAAVFEIEIAVYERIVKDGISRDSFRSDARHDLIFFKYPINYGSGIRNKFGDENKPFIADNNYNTFATERSFTIDTLKIADDTGSGGTKITHVFFKTENVDSFYTNLPGTGLPGTGLPTMDEPEDIPDTVVNWEGKSVPIDSDNTQNFLWSLPEPKTVESITINLMGNHIKVYEIAVLEQVLNLKANGQFTRIEYGLQDFGSILKKDLAERITKVPVSGSPRWQWQVEYTALLQSQDVNNINKEKDIYNKILNFIRDRTNNNFFVACEYTRYPQRCFPATFPNTEIGMAYLSDRFSGAGETISFTILES